MSEPKQTTDELNAMLAKAIYGENVPAIPSGYESTGRWIVCGQSPNSLVLSPSGRAVDEYVHGSHLPRLELRRVPEPPKSRTGEAWLNVYLDGSSGGFVALGVYRTNEAADDKASINRIFCQRVVLSHVPSVPGLIKYQFEAPEGQTPVVLVPTGEVRACKGGDWFEDNVGLQKWVASVPSHGQHAILRRIEPSRV